jgi:hypothetical protein
MKEFVSIPIYTINEDEVALIGERTISLSFNNIFYIHEYELELIHSYFRKLIDNMEISLHEGFTKEERDFLDDYLFDLVVERVFNMLDIRLYNLKIIPFDYNTFICIRRESLPYFDLKNIWEYDFTHLIKVVKIFPPKKVFQKIYYKIDEFLGMMINKKNKQQYHQKVIIKTHMVIKRFARRYAQIFLTNNISGGTFWIPKLIDEAIDPFLNMVEIFKNDKVDLINKYQVISAELRRFQEQNEIFQKTNKQRFIEKLRSAYLSIGDSKVKLTNIAKLMEYNSDNNLRHYMDKYDIEFADGIFIYKKTKENILLYKS